MFIIAYTVDSLGAWYATGVKRSKRTMTDEVLALVADRFRLLGEPARLRLLQSLETGERSVTDLAEVLNGNQPNTSRQLKALHDGGLLRRRRAGTTVYYSIADPIVFELCELVCDAAAEEAKLKLQVIRKARR